MNLAAATHRRNNFVKELESLNSEEKKFMYTPEARERRNERKDFLEIQIDNFNKLIEELKWKQVWSNVEVKA